VLHRPGVFRRIIVVYVPIYVYFTRSTFVCPERDRRKIFDAKTTSDRDVFLAATLRFLYKVPYLTGKGGGNETKQKPFVSVRKLPLNNASDILYYKCILLLYPCETANGFRFLPTRVCVCVYYNSTIRTRAKSRN